MNMLMNCCYGQVLELLLLHIERLQCYRVELRVADWDRHVGQGDLDARLVCDGRAAHPLGRAVAESVRAHAEPHPRLAGAASRRPVRIMRMLLAAALKVRGRAHLARLIRGRRLQLRAREPADMSRAIQLPASGVCREWQCNWLMNREVELLGRIELLVQLPESIVRCRRRLWFYQILCTTTHRHSSARIECMCVKLY